MMEDDPADLRIDPATARQELRDALPYLNDRGLYQSAKWAAELMLHIAEAKRNDPSSPGADTSAGASSSVEESASGSGLSEEGVPEVYEPLPREAREDEVVVAQTYFALREYKRVERMLSACQTPLARFLRCYAKYLSGEKRKEEEMAEASAPLERSKVCNRELEALRSELERESEADALDPLGKYLLGVVLKELDCKEEAAVELCDSLSAFPWNWSAWKELAELCPDRDTAAEIVERLPDHWMRAFFEAEIQVERPTEETMDAMVPLAKSFPRSTHVITQLAIVHYNLREFDEAQTLFEDLRSRDPFCLDHMDMYSNILYVKDMRATLSFLARSCVQTDKYRPETCCIVGNYYSLKNEHERAVEYFKRALRLDPNFLAAWTLMGHEFVEMRSTSAAIEAYRRAVDISPGDYRAWYGLGQTYEILQMHSYSLYYFRKAATLRPFDARMHCALAETYEKLDRTEDAIKCYLRAEGNSDREGIALHKLAKLYEARGDRRQAAHFYERVLARQEDMSDGPAEATQETVDALVFLAEFSKSLMQLELAETYCTRLLDVGVMKEQAKALLQEIHQLKRYAAARATTGT